MNILTVLPRNGVVAVVKRDCATCVLTAPVVASLARSGIVQAVFTQDDPAFPAGMDPVDDTALEVSWRLRIETVPSLVRFVDGEETSRTVGWSRTTWGAFLGTDADGDDILAAVPGIDDLPAQRPGCRALPSSRSWCGWWRAAAGESRAAGSGRQP